MNLRDTQSVLKNCKDLGTGQDGRTANVAPMPERKKIDPENDYLVNLHNGVCIQRKRL